MNNLNDNQSQPEDLTKRIRINNIIVSLQELTKEGDLIMDAMNRIVNKKQGRKEKDMAEFERLTSLSEEISNKKSPLLKEWLVEIRKNDEELQKMLDDIKGKLKK